MENGRIQAIYPYGNQIVDEDYGNLRIVPSFIDQHTMAPMAGIPMMHRKMVWRIGWKNIVKEGVTGISANDHYAIREVLTNAEKNVAKVVRDGLWRAEI